MSEQLNLPTSTLVIAEYIDKIHHNISEMLKEKDLARESIKC